MTYLTWRESGGTHYGERNGATMVRLYEVNAGITLRPEGRDRISALFIANWDAPVPDGWYGADNNEPFEWRGTRGTIEERDALLTAAKESCERTFVRWARLMSLLPHERVIVDVQRGDRLVITGTLEV